MPKGRVPRFRLLSELDSSLGACDSSEIAKPHFLKDTMTGCANPQGALLFYCSVPCIRIDSGEVTIACVPNKANYQKYSKCKKKKSLPLQQVYIYPDTKLAEKN